MSAVLLTELRGCVRDTDTPERFFDTTRQKTWANVVDPFGRGGL